jgi:DNA repair protein RadC
MNLSMFTREQLESVLLSAAPQLVACQDATAAPYDFPPADRARLIAERLAAARELLVRDGQRELIGKSTVDSPNAARDYLRLHFASLPSEVFIAIYLDTQHRVIECNKLFRGTLTQCSVYPREVVRCPIACNASSVMLSHQHPGSGNPEPSRADEY